MEEFNVYEELPFILNSRGYPLSLPNYKKVYTFFEEDGYLHQYIFLAQDKHPTKPGDKLTAVRDKKDVVKVTVARFDFLVRKNLSDITDLPKLPIYIDSAYRLVITHPSSYFSHTRDYTSEELEHLITNAKDVDF